MIDTQFLKGQDIILFLCVHQSFQLGLQLSLFGFQSFYREREVAILLCRNYAGFEVFNSFFNVFLLIFRRKRDHLKLRMTEDNSIVITGCNTRTERFPVLRTEIFFGRNKDIRAGIKLLKFCTPLLGQRLRHNDHRLVCQTEPPQLHCRCCYCPRFACTYAMCKQGIAAIQNASYGIALVIMQLDFGIDTGECKVTAVKLSRLHGIEMLVVVSHQPFTAFRVSKNPILERLTKRILRGSCLECGFRQNTLFFLAVYHDFFRYFCITQVKCEFKQIICSDAAGRAAVLHLECSTVFCERKRAWVLIFGFSLNSPTVYFRGILDLDFSRCIVRRANDLIDKSFNIFWRYPCSAEPHLNICCGQRFRLYLLQLFYVNGERWVCLRGGACYIELCTDIAGQILVRSLPLICFRVAENLLAQCGGDLFLCHAGKQRGHIIEVDFAALCQRQCKCVLRRIGVRCFDMRTDRSLAEDCGLAGYIFLIVQLLQCKQQRIARIVVKGQLVALLMEVFKFAYKRIIFTVKVSLQSVELFIVAAVALRFDQPACAVADRYHTNRTLRCFGVLLYSYKLVLCGLEQ